MAYYQINENSARTAHEMMSFRDYKTNEATNRYREQVDEAEQTLNTVLTKCKTEAQREHAKYLFDKYCRTLAFAINEENRIGCMCPSVMISGSGNFQTKKKERQVAAWDNNRKNFDYAQHLLYKLSNVHLQAIRSDDAEAIQALEEKLQREQESHDICKRVNAYYRKYKTLDGCDDLSEKAKQQILKNWDSGWCVGIPFPSYVLQNSNQRIKALKERIEELKSIKESEDIEKEYDGFRYLENSEIMRIQFFFDGKPNEETRRIIKSYGFKWSPSQSAWQRQLTLNGKRAAEHVIEELQNKNLYD